MPTESESLYNLTMKETDNVQKFVLPPRAGEEDKEPHFGGEHDLSIGGEIIRDVVIGLSDGLTVPFALAAGLATLGNSRLVVLAGMSEIVAGSIAMSIGGYLAGRSEIEHYDSEEMREYREIKTMPEQEILEVLEIFEQYGLDRDQATPVIKYFQKNPRAWIDFMMKFELGLERPESSRQWISALTIGASFFIGGLVPLIPFMIVKETLTALYVSVAGTLVVLFLFGYVKATILGLPSTFSSGLQMMIVGAAASGAAFGIAKALPVPEFPTSTNSSMEIMAASSTIISGSIVEVMRTAIRQQPQAQLQGQNLITTYIPVPTVLPAQLDQIQSVV